MSQRDPAHEVFTNPYILSIIKSHRNDIKPLLKNNAKMQEFLQSITPRGNTRSIMRTQGTSIRFLPGTGTKLSNQNKIYLSKLYRDKHLSKNAHVTVGNVRYILHSPSIKKFIKNKNQ
jgi:hypothetical protein